MSDAEVEDIRMPAPIGRALHHDVAWLSITIECGAAGSCPRTIEDDLRTVSLPKSAASAYGANGAQATSSEKTMFSLALPAEVAYF